MQNLLSGGSTMSVIVIYAIAFGAIYFLFMRPNMKKKKELQKMRDELKAGDKIVTIGGFIGVLESVKEDEVVFKCNGNSLKVKRSAIHSIVTD